MELIKINENFKDLEVNSASNLSAAFKPMLDLMESMEIEFNETMEMELSEEKMKLCRDLRLRHVKVRTGTDVIHKKQKERSLLEGRAIDGWRATQRAACIGIEDKLLAVEKHYENIEKERLIKLQEDRALQLKKFEQDFIPDNLGIMQDEVWSNYISGIEAGYKVKKDAEAKAEKERLEAEEAERQRQIEVEKENKRLKVQAAKRQKEDNARVEKERKAQEKREKIEAGRIAKENKESEAREEAERIKEEAHQAELEKERKKQEKIKADSQEKERIAEEAREEAERKLKEKEEAEKAEADRIAKEKADDIEAELNKGDAEKFEDLIMDLKTISKNYSFKSTKNKQLYKDVCSKLDVIISDLHEV